MTIKTNLLKYTPIFLLLSSVPACAQVHVVAPSEPATVGFDAQRLEKLNVAMDNLVTAGQLSGAVTVLARHGEIVNIGVYGRQDIDTQTDMQANSVFRLYSMTKPITGVAMMILYEDGLWHPDDPLSSHIPEFADLKVFAGIDEDGKVITEELARQPTLGELMSHTAGFTYGPPIADSPVDRLYAEANPMGAGNLQDLIDILAGIPLQYQPGTAWRYSISVDIQGYLVEKLSGMSLPDFMQARIFNPLRMTDTGFNVPESKLDRLATVYRFDNEAGRLAPMPRAANVTEIPGAALGGIGLYSTAQDYYRFAQMLANGGELEGARILSPSTIELMRTNRLSDELMHGGYGIGVQQIRPGFGFGLDVAVFTNPAATGSTIGEGAYLWDGAAGTWFWIDPTNDVVFIGMIQRMGGMRPVNIQQLTRSLVYQALAQPDL